MEEAETQQVVGDADNTADYRSVDTTGKKYIDAQDNTETVFTPLPYGSFSENLISGINAIETIKENKSRIHEYYENSKESKNISETLPPIRLPPDAEDIGLPKRLPTHELKRQPTIEEVSQPSWLADKNGSIPFGKLGTFATFELCETPNGMAKIIKKDGDLVDVELLEGGIKKQFKKSELNVKQLVSRPTLDDKDPALTDVARKHHMALSSRPSFHKSMSKEQTIQNHVRQMSSKFFDNFMKQSSGINHTETVEKQNSADVGIATLPSIQKLQSQKHIDDPKTFLFPDGRYVTKIEKRSEPLVISHIGEYKTLQDNKGVKAVFDENTKILREQQRIRSDESLPQVPSHQKNQAEKDCNVVKGILNGTSCAEPPDLHVDDINPSDFLNAPGILTRRESFILRQEIALREAQRRLSNNLMPSIDDTVPQLKKAQVIRNV